VLQVCFYHKLDDILPTTTDSDSDDGNSNELMIVWILEQRASLMVAWQKVSSTALICICFLAYTEKFFFHLSLEPSATLKKNIQQRNMQIYVIPFC